MGQSNVKKFGELEKGTIFGLVWEGEIYKKANTLQSVNINNSNDIIQTHPDTEVFVLKPAINTSHNVMMSPILFEEALNKNPAFSNNESVKCEDCDTPAFKGPIEPFQPHVVNKNTLNYLLNHSDDIVHMPELDAFAEKYKDIPMVVTPMDI